MKRLSLLGVALSLACGPALAQASKAPDAPPGQGVICAWATVGMVAEVGERCFPGEDPDFQREARAAVGRFDAYVLNNSKMTPADVAAFKRQQGVSGAPLERLCKGDAVQIYRAFHAKGAPALRSVTASATARDGEPTWGDCF